MDRTSFIRVTSIIGEFSGVKDVPKYILDKAAARGSQVHFEIQNLLSGFEQKVENEELVGYLNSFAKFWKDSMHAFVDSKIILEKRLYCDQYEITGQIDAIIQGESKTYIFDWKTSSRLQEASWRLQAAAYRYLCEINGFENLADPVFVKLDRDGKDPVLFKCDQYEEDLERFFNALDLYRYFNLSEKKWK